MNRPKLVHGLLAALLTVAAVALHGAAALWLTHMVRQWTQSPAVYEYASITREGEPLIQVRRDAYSDVEVRSLDGRVLDLDANAATWLSMGHLPPPPDPRSIYFPPAWAARLRGFNDHGRPAVYWYLVHDGRSQGAAWLEGYDPRSKQRLGYLGRHGLSAAPPPPVEHFPIAGRRLQHSFSGVVASNHYAYNDLSLPSYTGTIASPRGLSPNLLLLSADDGVYRVDLRARQVEPWLAADDIVSIAIVNVGTEFDDRGAWATEQRIVVRRADTLGLYDLEGAELLRVTLPAEFAGQLFSVGQTDDGRLVMTSTRYQRSLGQLYEIVRFQADGELDDRQQVVLNRGDQRPSWWSAFEVLAVLPSPAPLAAVCLVVEPLQQVAFGEQPSFRPALASSWRRSWPVLVCVVLLSAGLAVLTHRRERRYGARRLWLWPAVVLAFGWPAFLAHRVHRRWPTLAACEACDRPVPRDRDACCACGAAFPAAGPLGTEVFA